MSPESVAVSVDGHTLTLTNLAKVLYPETGFTKAEVLSYYQQVAPVLLPHITGRPLTLKRYPDGVDGEAFFAKHAPAYTPDWIRTVLVESSSSRARGETVTYLVVDDLPALIWVANLAGLELHAPMWRLPVGVSSPMPGGPSRLAPAAPDGPARRAPAVPDGPARLAPAVPDGPSRLAPAVPDGRSRRAPAVPDGPDREPDLLVFDLDPGLPATIVECCAVALDLLPILRADGLEPLAKTSGGKGMQLYARVAGMTSAQASDMARGYAERLERDRPRQVTARMTKALRSGRVFIDWSQNNGKKTTVAPYSLRARSQPTVSTPLTWDEVAACTEPADLTFTADDLPARLETHGDLFAPLLPS